MSDKTNRVAVYGTLKAGFHNHQLMDNAEYVGSCNVQGTMHSLGGFPAVTLVGDNQIHCEIWDVDDAALKRLDRLEGIPTFYQRNTVDTPYGTAWIYTMEASELMEFPIVKSGNWERSVNYA